MPDPDKSALDNVPVVEDEGAKKLFAKAAGKAPPKPKDLVIISRCEKCGSPIYGLPRVAQGDTPPIVRTCACQHNTMQTK